MSRTSASPRCAGGLFRQGPSRLFPLLLAVCLPASAQQASTQAPAATSDARAYVDLARTSAGYDCSPRPIGSGTVPTLRHNAAGSVVWWYCPTPAGAWRVNWAAATAESLSMKNLFAELRTVIAASDSRTAFDAAVQRHVTVPLTDPSLVPVWQPYQAEMLSGAPAKARELNAPRAPAASRSTLDASSTRTP